MSPVPSEQHLIDVKLIERAQVRRNAEVEHERAVAIFDLLEENRFAPVGDYHGPYILHIGLSDGKLSLEIHDGADAPLGRIVLSLGPFRGLIRDYFAICDSYYDAIRRLSPSRIETIDMARRAIHNDGAKALRQSLTGKVEIDDATARRLFTLLCVLHARA